MHLKTWIFDARPMVRGRRIVLVITSTLVILSLSVLGFMTMMSASAASISDVSHLVFRKPSMSLASAEGGEKIAVNLEVEVENIGARPILESNPPKMELLSLDSTVLGVGEMQLDKDVPSRSTTTITTQVLMSPIDCKRIASMRIVMPDELWNVDTTSLDREFSETAAQALASADQIAARQQSDVPVAAPAEEPATEPANPVPTAVPAYSADDFSDTFIIGDSVLALSGGEGGYGDKISEGLPNVSYDAESGRYFDSDVLGDPNDGMIDIAHHVAGKYKRYVVECGINDAGLTRAMADEFVSTLLGDGVQLYFVNQRVIGGADDTTCSTIRAVAATTEGVYEIDWNSMCSGHEDEWLLDICHPNETGAEQLVSCIRKALADHASDAVTPAEAPTTTEETSEEEKQAALDYHDSEDIDKADLRISTEGEIAGWAERIDAYLEGSELAGYGRLFAECAAKYQVDPRLSPAISTIESGKGAICAASYNAWGWGGPGNWASWGSWEEAIEGHVSGLANNGYASMGAEECARYCDWSYWDGDPSFCLKTEVLKI